MQRLDLCVLRACQKINIVALDGLIEERQADQQHHGGREGQLPPDAGPWQPGTRFQSAVLVRGCSGVHRSTGRRAAVTSSTRLVRVLCGALRTISGSVSTSCAIEIMASAKRSSSSLLSVSVGSIISAPSTMRGRLTVYG